ncbi:fumarylacetoacetate hydrolase family protein [Kribbella sp. NPDC059898]|uniref:fumarylacetoacetate hydrolase family protein n=1 Tax=Kribbella sp. NPDC059898 TaxID=3346995 RepID=UPI00365C661A
MRLLRIHTPDGLRDAILTDDGRVQLPDGAALDLAEVRLAAPLDPGKIVCVGLNYADHAAEGGQEAPAEPILFLKTPDTVVGPYDDIVIPRGSEKTDWEVELGVVIGRTAAYLGSAAEALDHVAGYVLVNDVSERHFQLERGGQWDKGKNCPTFCPLGPWILTADEVPDPQAIKLGLEVNGEPLQDSSTAEMIFGVGYLVHYISQFMTLYPGDVISTGTPAGVGAGQKPPRYLKEGDVLRTWADGLGEQRNKLVASS